MAQVTIRRPLGEFELRDELRFEPVAVFHFFQGKRPLRASFLRQIGKRADLGFHCFHLRHDLAANMRDKTGAYLARKEELAAMIVADDHGIKWISRRVAADDELLALVDLVFNPRKKEGDRLPFN